MQPKGTHVRGEKLVSCPKGAFITEVPQGYGIQFEVCSTLQTQKLAVLTCTNKRWSTNREAPHAYTQPEGIGYFVGTVCRGRSNYVTFEPKSDQPSN